MSSNYDGYNVSYNEAERRYVLRLLNDRASRHLLPEILTHVLRCSLHLSFPSLLSDLAAAAASIRRPVFARCLLLISSIPDLSLFNATIKSLSFFPSDEPFRLFSLLRSAGLRPDRQTFAPLLKSCSLLPSLQPGSAVHASAVVGGFESHAAVSIQLVGLYAHFGRMEDAQKVFDAMPHRETVVWNLMINGFCKRNELDTALRLFRQTNERNVVTWNTMLAGFARAGRDVEVVELFLEMWDLGVEPDDATVVTVLPVCARTGNSELGRRIHNYAENKDLSRTAINVGNSLVDMYCKCADLESARLVFDEMPRKNVVSWNTMINGLAVNGCGRMGLQLFDEMLCRGIEPNASTFVSVLGCCNHAGLVETGRELFQAMKVKYKIKPGAEHYGCMVDLLGRCGRTREALELIKEMPLRPNAAIWGSLLSACRNSGDIEVAEAAVKVLMDLEPENSGNFVLLANLYADAGRWQDAEKIWSKMRGMRIWKNTAQSAIEFGGY
ncbi:hypothetical protein HPP92_017647 [Vanilla planifolia]|uniref:Pentatricopeptide repeat-containing protein n=1 Tax=Vanilla planifolia TaxID=51239 RepID=A0A835Q9N5_VANPL|nr:hypothetical protein HPP92_017647 [Vanilla planifolia]